MQGTYVFGIYRGVETPWLSMIACRTIYATKVHIGCAYFNIGFSCTGQLATTDTCRRYTTEGKWMKF